MSSEPASTAAVPHQRAQWADVVRGACIVLVAPWHVAVTHYPPVGWHLGVPLPVARGVLGEQLLALRMPLFFTISGVFALDALARPWRELGRSPIAARPTPEVAGTGLAAGTR